MTKLKRLTRRGSDALPAGTLTVAVGLAVAGVSAYLFLSVAGKTLGTEKMSPLSQAWSLLFLGGPGFFMPLEQEVARAIAARRALGVGAKPVFTTASRLAVFFAAGIIGLVLLGSGFIVNDLLDGSWLLFFGLIAGLVGYSVEHLMRGGYSGSGEFRPYAMILGGEAAWRALIAVVLAVAGVKSVGPYGIALGVAPFLAVAVARGVRKLDLDDGPPAPRSELSEALVALLAASVLAQLLVNIGVLAVKVLEPQSSKNLSAIFLAAVIVARIPLFLYQAIQAALLPNLARLWAAGAHSDFRSGLRRLLLIVGAVGALAMLGTAVLGPFIVHKLFDPTYDVERSVLVLLSLSSAGYMLSLTLAQALIALERQALSALGWIPGVGGFLCTVAVLGGDLFHRVAISLVVACWLSFATMAVLALKEMASVGDTVAIQKLVDAVEHEILEP